MLNLFFKTLIIRNLSFSSCHTTELFVLSEVKEADILKALTNKAGIYKWTNLVNGKSYVGSSANLRRRIQEYLNHKRSLRELARGESMVYKALLKYGYINFTLEILETLDISKLTFKDAKLLLLSPSLSLIYIYIPPFFTDIVTLKKGVP